MSKEFSDDDWIFDPTLADVGQRMRREIRDEARNQERNVARDELSMRQLGDIARELHNRGDAITISTQRRTFNGYIVNCGDDFLSIKSETAQIEIPFAALDFFKTAPNGRSNPEAGRAISDPARNFSMRLQSLENPYARVELGFKNRDEILLARITTVGQDHIVAADDHRNSWVIPLHSLAFVICSDIERNKKGRR